MKIGLITQWFEPESGSAALPSSIARSLVRRGHEVTVLTGYPNYPTGVVHPDYRLAPHMREVRDGLEIHRVFLYPSHDRRPVRRMANFASFAVASAGAAPGCLKHVDAALVYSTPATVGLAGVALSQIRGIPFVLYIQDMWPDTLLASEMLPARIEGPVSSLTSGFCRWVYSRAAEIAVIAPSMHDLLLDRGVEGKKISVVYNWADEEIFDGSRVRKNPNQSGSFEVMYAGSLGDIQGLEVVVEAMAILPKDEKIQLRLVGSGVAEPGLRDLVVRRGLSDRVTFEGPKSISDMPDIMASADVQLLCLRDLPMFHGTVPSKFQAILACGRPVITVAPGDVGKLTEDSGAGISVKPESPEQLAAAILSLSRSPATVLDQMGERGLAFYRRELSEAVGGDRLEKLLERASKQGVKCA